MQFVLVFVCSSSRDTCPYQDSRFILLLVLFFKLFSFCLFVLSGHEQNRTNPTVCFAKWYEQIKSYHYGGKSEDQCTRGSYMCEQYSQVRRKARERERERERDRYIEKGIYLERNREKGI